MEENGLREEGVRSVFLFADVVGVAVLAHEGVLRGVAVVHALEQPRLHARDRRHDALHADELVDQAARQSARRHQVRAQRPVEARLEAVPTVQDLLSRGYLVLQTLHQAVLRQLLHVAFEHALERRQRVQRALHDQLRDSRVPGQSRLLSGQVVERKDDPRLAFGDSFVDEVGDVRAIQVLLHAGLELSPGRVDVHQVIK